MNWIIILIFQEVEKYAKLVDSIQYNSQKVCLPKLNINFSYYPRQI